jgi:hypothetical protein
MRIASSLTNMHTSIVCVVAASAAAVLLGCSSKSNTQPPQPAVSNDTAQPSGATDTSNAKPPPPPPPAPPPTTPTASDAGEGGAGSAAADGGPAQKDVAACLAACEAKYPNSAIKAKAIDQCWADNCAACQNMANAPLQSPINGDCQNPVYTPSEDCSQCTADACCAAWDDCFGDAECQALNACANTCWK